MFLTTLEVLHSVANIVYLPVLHATQMYSRTLLLRKTEVFPAHLLPYNSGGTSERAAVRNNAKGKN